MIRTSCRTSVKAEAGQPPNTLVQPGAYFRWIQVQLLCATLNYGFTRNHVEQDDRLNLLAISP
jgi:hypothetical protein